MAEKQYTKRFFERWLMGELHKARFHWFYQRFESVFLVFLYIWLIKEGVGNAGGMLAADLEIWLLKPLNSILLSLTILISFSHTRLGLEEVALDYVHSPMRHRLTVLMINFVCRLLPLMAILAIIFVYLR